MADHPPFKKIRGGGVVRDPLTVIFPSPRRKIRT